jgi:hypothetical protein
MEQIFLSPVKNTKNSQRIREIYFDVLFEGEKYSFCKNVR